VDQELQELERHAVRAPSPEARRAVARAYLRRGLPGRALAWARSEPGGLEHASAVSGLADQLGLSLLRPETAEGEWFVGRDGTRLVLVPGGAHLEDGACAWASILRPGGSRAPLERVVLPGFLVGVAPRGGARSQEEARERAAALGGRLPTPPEWKKAWRGGLWLDGDLTCERRNSEPDRIGPWGNQAPDPRAWRSPYGVEFLPDAWEWTEGPEQFGAGFRAGRYLLPLGDPSVRRGRRLLWRLVIDVEARSC
jgi:hypothetical protein